MTLNDRIVHLKTTTSHYHCPLLFFDECGECGKECVCEMKEWTGSYKFDVSFKQLCHAILNRYPNPFSNHVLTEDIIERVLINGVLITKKIISKCGTLPKWSLKFFHGNLAYVIEESRIDLKTKTIQTFSYNLNHKSIIYGEENMLFKPIPNSTSSSTYECVRHATCKSKAKALSSAIEYSAMKLFKMHATKTIKGIQFSIDRITLLNNKDRYPSSN